MKLKGKIKVLVLIIVSLLAGFYFYQKWTPEIRWGIFFVIIFVVVPIWIVVAMRLWARCPRCRKYGAIQTIGAELRKKGIDPHRLPDPSTGSTDEKEESSLDLSMDLYDLFCRYRCKICDFEWEEKPPPIHIFGSPRPPYENGSEN
jgi:hypothetical protein